MTLIKQGPIEQIDGHNLYYTFLAGARKLIKHQVELDRINVFPVNDGDTGTNLASTIRSAAESLLPHRSFKITIDRIAESALVNARGNSGIIFAQFIYGLSNETGDFRSVSPGQFAESIRRSVRYIYEAVANPVEGTMLTVIKEWAEFIYQSWHRFTDFSHLLIGSYEILLRSLQETKSKLSILAKNNVVDAGARGFVLFIEGIIEFINSGNVKELILAKPETISFPKIAESIPEKIDFRYCTEAIIKNSKSDNASLKEILSKYGDSIVVAGSDSIRRVHVHTDSPSALFDELRHYGTLAFQKADDMIRQSQAVYNRKWNIALVTDSTCDLAQELIDHYQINILPINISFGENHYLDKITIQPEQFYGLLDESRDYPKSSQVNETALINLFSRLSAQYDSIIAIHLSDKFSGTFNSSVRAAKSVSSEFNKPVTVLNSRNISGALGLIVLRMARAIESGTSHDQIIRMAEKWINDAHILVSVKTLKYMVKGGRVSAFRGFLARILNINPIVSIDETGNATVFGKAFSLKASMAKVIANIRSSLGEKKIWNYVVLHASNETGAGWFSDKMEKLTGKKPVSVCNISPVIGANAGKGAVSVAFLYE